MLGGSHFDYTSGPLAEELKERELKGHLRHDLVYLPTDFYTR